MLLTPFVQMTSSNAAKPYGLPSKRGNIVPGFGADLIIWYPGQRGARTDSQIMLHHGVRLHPIRGHRSTKLAKIYYT